MSDLQPVQRELARLLFSLPEAAGYALAGGAALLTQQIIDRDTRDLDAFIAATPGPAPGIHRPARGLNVSAIAEAFERGDSIPDDRFSDGTTDAATTRRFFTTWLRDLLDHH